MLDTESVQLVIEIVASAALIGTVLAVLESFFGNGQ